jgi:phage gp36-like protein
VVARALAVASSQAESYLDGETIPDPVPLALSNAVVALAVHLMAEARHAGTDSTRQSHADAIKWLEAIAGGKATLTPAEGAAAAAESFTAPALDESDVLAEGQLRMWNRRDASRVF